MQKKKKIPYKRVSCKYIGTFVFLRCSLHPIECFCHYYFFISISCRHVPWTFWTGKKTLFKLLHQRGLVDVRVKQFVSEGKKVNGSAGHYWTRRTALPTGLFRRDNFSLTTSLPRVLTITRVLVYLYVFFLWKTTTKNVV